jgi:hypothetical protein
MLDRASLKDYLDMDALLRSGLELPAVLAAAKAIYGERFTPYLSIRALTCFIEGDVTELAPEAQRRLSAAALAVNLEGLPQMTAKPGLLPERQGL